MSRCAANIHNDRRRVLGNGCWPSALQDQETPSRHPSSGHLAVPMPGQQKPAGRSRRRGTETESIFDTFHPENAEASPPQTCTDIPATAACGMRCFSVSYPRSLVVWVACVELWRSTFRRFFGSGVGLSKFPRRFSTFCYRTVATPTTPRFASGWGGQGRRGSDGALRLKIKKNCPVTGIGERDTRRAADECGSTNPPSYGTPRTNQRSKLWNSIRSPGSLGLPWRPPSLPVSASKLSNGEWAGGLGCAGRPA